jgi:hypothetical protein
MRNRTSKSKLHGHAKIVATCSTQSRHHKSPLSLSGKVIEYEKGNKIFDTFTETFEDFNALYNVDLNKDWMHTHDGTELATSCQRQTSILGRGLQNAVLDDSVSVLELQAASIDLFSGAHHSPLPMLERPLQPLSL